MRNTSILDCKYHPVSQKNKSKINSVSKKYFNNTNTVNRIQ